MELYQGLSLRPLKLKKAHTNTQKRKTYSGCGHKRQDILTKATNEKEKKHKQRIQKQRQRKYQKTKKKRKRKQKTVARKKKEREHLYAQIAVGVTTILVGGIIITLGFMVLFRVYG